MPVAETEQRAIDEVAIDNPELEAALEARQAAKEEQRRAAKAARDADAVAKAAAAALDLPHGVPHRCGRFVLTRRATPGRSVSFEVEAGERLTFKLSPSAG